MSDMPLAELLSHLERLVADALRLWHLPPDARAKLINVSENATYLVSASNGFQAVLRVHRDSYHSRRAIECELAWIAALRESETVVTPGVRPGKDGKAIQMGSTAGLSSPRYLVMFEHVEGVHPEETGDLTNAFEDLGRIAARTHLHSLTWEKPLPFERLTWDVDAVFGPVPTWGNWRDAPRVDDTVCDVLENVEATVRTRLQAFGKSKNRYGLIHADMRLANLLIDGDVTRLIDFDDCGLGWFLYDFAAAISFIEDDPQIPALKEAWVRGYRKIRPISVEEEHEIDSFIMLRRMALLAWIGSHIEAPEPQAMAPHFAADTAKLGKVYLDTYS